MSSLAPIKNWKPRHENVVILHLNGWGNDEIAKHLRITPVRVAQILQDPQAMILKAAVMKRVRENLSGDITDRLLELTELSVEKIAETLEATFVLGTDPKKHQDNVALQIVKGKGFLSGAEVPAETRDPQIPVSLLERFTAAMEKSNEAKRLHSGESNVIKEADVEIIEEDSSADSNS